MQKASKSLQITGSLIVVLLFVGICIGVAWYLIQLLDQLEPPVQAAFITAIVGITSLVVSNFYVSQREIGSKLREKKIEVYSDFLEVWITTFFSGTHAPKGEHVEMKGDSDKTTSDNNQEELVKRLRSITDDLILWSSDDAIKAYSDLRNNQLKSQASEVEKFANLVKFGKLMLLLRKDLGHKNKDIDEYDLMSLFINDIDKIKILKPQIDAFLESDIKTKASST